MEIQNEESKTKTAGQKLKSGVIIAILTIVGWALGYILGIYGYAFVIGPAVSQYKYKQALEEYIKPYKEDFVGGDTPEETVDLFIEALKKGDYELASRYFVVDEQEKWKKMFNEATKQQNEDWAKEIEDNKKLWRKEKQDEKSFEFWYNIGEGEDERTHSIYLEKNMNNKWKIESF